MRPMRGKLGLLGRILAILLLTVVIEFGASTLLYERASRFLVREDEAHRLAEHLVIARKLVFERPPATRGAIAGELSTDRYKVRWTPSLRAPMPLAPELQEMRRQIETWEPALARSDMRLRLARDARRSTVFGALRLPDGSWLHFSAYEIVRGWNLVLGRIVLALIPALALLAIGGLLIRRTLQPLRMLARVTERVGIDEEIMLPESGTNEVRHLIRAFNQMHERIHRLIADRTQSLAAVGHDLRTPLARLQLRLDAIADPSAREAITADVGEMEAMLASMMAFLGGEQDPEQPVLIDLAILAQTLVDDATDRGGNAGYAGPDHLETMLRPIGMRRALTNLIENALHYGGVARVTLLREAGRILIRVEDDGPGIPDDRLEDVLVAFTRLDAARGRNTKGLGLGLAIVVQAVAREAGVLRLTNRPEGGLRAEIQLPPAA